jgi:hypothetical protein
MMIYRQPIYHRFESISSAAQHALPSLAPPWCLGGELPRPECAKPSQQPKGAFAQPALAALGEMCYCARMIYAEGIIPEPSAALEATQGLCLPSMAEFGRRGSPGGSPSQRLDAEGRFGNVRPSQTQSHLVKPSPTLNFREPDKAEARVSGAVTTCCGI